MKSSSAIFRTALTAVLSVVSVRVVMASAALEDFIAANRAPSGSAVQVGVWNEDVAACKKYAYANGIPMVAIWANKGCAHCEIMEKALNSDYFRNWAKSCGMVLAFSCSTDPHGVRQGSEGSDSNPGNGYGYWFCKRPSMPTQYPFVRFYWYKGGKKIVDYSVKGDTVDGQQGIWNGKYDKAGQKVVDYIVGTSGLGAYSPSGSSSSGGETTVITSNTTFTVTFNIGAHGMRTGGGSLIQSVSYGGSAIPPTVSAADGWAFSGWDVSFINVTSDLTVSAQWREDATVINPDPEAEAAKPVQLWRDGPLFSDRNVGASEPDESGLYFWWGDTKGYSRTEDGWTAGDGSETSFKFLSSTAPTWGKEVTSLRSDGWITGDGILAPRHDAAKMHWGGSWRMPTEAELKALVDNCTWTWSSTGTVGYVVSGKGEFSDASIFLPASGYAITDSRYSYDTVVCLWTSTPSASGTTSAMRGSFSALSRPIASAYRYYGCTVRPVRDSSHTVTFSLGEHGTRSGGGDLVQTVEPDGAAVAPEVEAAEGWFFIGWDADFSFVSANMTVNAVYRQYSLAVTLNANGGAVSETRRTLNSAADFARLPVPSRTGYVFDGWWTAASGGTSVTAANIYNWEGSLTLYAHWRKAYTLKTSNGAVIAHGDATGSSVSVIAGDVAEIRAAEASSGKVFAGWQIAPGDAQLGTNFCVTGECTIVTMPFSDVTLTPVYATAPGYVTVLLVESNDTGNDDSVPSGIEWTADNKVWFDATDGFSHPVSASETGKKVRIDFRSKDARYLAPASVTLTLFTSAEALVPGEAVRVNVVDVAPAFEGDAAGSVKRTPANGQVPANGTVVLTAAAAPGSVFVGWVAPDGSYCGNSASLKVSPAMDSEYVARFRLKEDCVAPQIETYADTSVPMVGVAHSGVFSVNDAALPVKFSAKGLPPGLKVDPSSGVVGGVPTKAGTFAATITAKSAANPKFAAATRTETLTVEPIPGWATGNFTGFSEYETGLGNGKGSAQFTVSSVGKMSGKVVFLGTNMTFAAASYDAYDGTSFTASAIAKSGKFSLPLKLWVTGTEATGSFPATATFEGCDEKGLSLLVAGSRSPWSEKTASSALAPHVGYYTASIDQGDAGYGHYAMTVDKAGKAKLAGRLANGRTFSTSAAMGSVDGRPVVFAYAKPSGTKADGVFVEALLSPDGLASSVRTVDFETQYLNVENGVGEHPVTGAWYSKTDSLADHYSAIRVSDGTVPPAFDGIPAAEIDWSKAEIELNARGTAFVVPKTDRSPSLKFSFAKATGLFSGSFSALYDQGNGKPFYRTFKFYGAAVHAEDDDLLRGAYVETGSYSDAKTGKKVNYTEPHPLVFEK